MSAVRPAITTAGPSDRRVLDSAPQQIDVDGRIFRVFHRAGTDPARPPLLLLNGFGCSAEVFAPLVEALGRKQGVIAIDPPGIGGSPPPRWPYRLSGYACRIGRILDRLDVREVDALGISWGGAIAQQFAFQNPRRCRRLILVSTGPAPIMRLSWDTLREMVWPKRFDPEYGRDIAARLYGGKVAKDKSLLDMLKQEIPNRGGEFFQQLAILGWTSLPYLRLIRQQTLVLSGRDDAIIPLFNARLFQTMMPHAQTHIYDDGHLGLLTSARELSPVIHAFLTA